MHRSEMRHLAQLGARVRLEQLAVERDNILRTFPVLRPQRSPPAVVAPVRRMSRKSRRAISERMKAYWKQRRK